MIRRLTATFLFLSLLLISASCKKSDTSVSSEPSFLTDETADAVQLVSEANQILKGVKKIYKENENKIQSLKEAMNGKDVETVKKLSDDFVYQINDGMTLGEDALKKVEEASQKNISPKFQEYLDLKKQSLRKQLEAFEFRRQLARQLRDAFKVTKDAAMLERAKGELKQKEDSFRKLMDDARELSRDANDLAKSKTDS